MPSSATRAQLLLPDLQLQSPCGNVDRDPVPLLNQPDRSAHSGLRRHVPDAWPSRGSRESSVRDQRGRLPQTHAHQRGRRFLHLLHSGAASGSLVSDHHHVPGADTAVQNRPVRVLLAIERTGRSFVPQHPRCDRGPLHHRAVGRETSPQNGDPPLRTHRIRERSNHLRIPVSRALQILPHRPSGHRRPVEMKQVLSLIHQRGHPSGLVRTVERMRP